MNSTAAPDDRAPLVAYEWPYLQVADRIEDRIRRGEFGEDGQLPGTFDLAEWYGVSVEIIRHARKELKDRGLVRVVLRHGTYVRPGAIAHKQAE